MILYFSKTVLSIFLGLNIVMTSANANEINPVQKVNLSCQTSQSRWEKQMNLMCAEIANAIDNGALGQAATASRVTNGGAGKMSIVLHLHHADPHRLSASLSWDLGNGRKSGPTINKDVQDTTLTEAMYASFARDLIRFSKVEF